MKHFGKIFIALVFCLVIFDAHTQNAEFRWGLIGKLEFNRLKIENAENRPEVVYEPGLKGGLGLYTAVNLNRYWFIDASVLLSRAKYSPDYTRGNTVFMDADVRFTQVNLCLNLVLNPRSERANVFLFGGAQLLYRRWGEERYVNDVVANSYWPVTRILTQAGLGVKLAAGRSYYLQPFAGFRYATEQQLVYDASMNQVFVGLVVCKGIKGKPKNRYNKCPTGF
jgi:hypothetical protein